MQKKRMQGVLVFCMIGALLGIWALGQERPERISYTDFWALVQEGEVVSVLMDGSGEWQGETLSGQKITTPDPRSEGSKEKLLQWGVDVKEKQANPPVFVLAALAAGAVWLLSRGRGGAVGMKSYAAVDAQVQPPDVTLSDVAASPDTMQSMRDLVAFLRSPRQFACYGARIPRGVLLYGPPGTGKTLLARALAGEAKTPFFAVNGADFVQVYVGVGASRVRELFKKARKAGGGVIFIDEIDAIGKRRDSGNEEREQTLNALLTEMSGFSPSDGILVLAATNRVDTLDGALLREGRFDRRIQVGLPDYEERLKILQVHARNKPLTENCSLEDVARQTALFSGAQLETLLNEAAIRAARRQAEAIEEEDLNQALCMVAVGEERPGAMTGEEKRITASHEAGHAVVTHYLLPKRRITRATIIPSSRGAAGYAMSVEEDRLLHTKRELFAMICAALGGRAAEEMLLGTEDVTTGAASDLKRAREIAAAMATEFAMGDTGESGQDEKLIFQKAFDAARRCLGEHREQLECLARALLEKETLGEEDILAQFRL